MCRQEGDQSDGLCTQRSASAYAADEFSRISHWDTESNDNTTDHHGGCGRKVDDEQRYFRQSRRKWTFSTTLLILLSAILLSGYCVRADDMEEGDDAWRANAGVYSFDGVSVMPVSCIQYNNGHMIKFELFENSNLQCRANSLGVFVSSISHYMRAYFNYEALIKGNKFSLPFHAYYLSCNMIRETAYLDQQLYAKIGCMDRDTFSSTKLQLRVYTDNMCSQPYDDGNTDRYHSRKGYELEGYRLSTKVAFRPSFYSCMSCAPEQISDTFDKSDYWYDDDYINAQNAKKNNQNNNNGDEDADEDADAEEDQDDLYYDDYYVADDDYFNDDANDADDYDDAYFAANDDLYNDDANDAYAKYNQYYNDDANGGDDAADDANGGDDAADDDANGGDDAADDDANGGDDAAGDDAADDAAARRRYLAEPATAILPAASQFEAYRSAFMDEVQRSLIDIEDWNMCDRFLKYGIYCDEECRALDTFRVNRWSHSDIFLLTTMSVFVAIMMLLIVAKRIKAHEKAKKGFGGENVKKPGFPPMIMFVIFMIIMTLIGVLAGLNFVNETLLFSAVVCIFLFGYMLKLTFDGSRQKQLLLDEEED